MNEYAEYLCKGKTKEDKWVEGYFILTRNIDDTSTPDLIITHIDAPFKYYQFLHVDPNTIVRCSGRVDMNGIKIFNRDIIKWMDSYELTKATRLFNDYVDDLSNWYIRRSRKKFQKEEAEEATRVLHYVISKLIKLIAPFTPFISEGIYQKMGNKENCMVTDGRNIKEIESQVRKT